MNKMTSRLAILALAMGTTTLAPLTVAQDAPSGDAQDGRQGGMQHAAPDPQKAAARWARQLGLSDDQTSKLTAILQDRQQKMAALKNDSSSSPQDRHQQMHTIQQDSETQINGILTPDQQTKYAQLKQAMKSRWQNKHSAPGESSSS